MRLPPWTVFHDPFSNGAVRTGSRIIKIGFFPLVEQTQAKNKLNGNLVVQTFQKQSLSIPKTNTAFLLETSVWHSEVIQFWSDSSAALSPSRDKWTLYNSRGLPSWHSCWLLKVGFCSHPFIRRGWTVLQPFYNRMVKSWMCKMGYFLRSYDLKIIAIKVWIKKAKATWSVSAMKILAFCSYNVCEL